MFGLIAIKCMHHLTIYTQKKTDLPWMQTRGIDSSHDVRRVTNDQMRVLLPLYYNYYRS
jgi:hypothetical protein